MAREESQMLRWFVSICTPTAHPSGGCSTIWHRVCWSSYVSDARAATPVLPSTMVAVKTLY